MQTIFQKICQNTMYSRTIPVFMYKIKYPCFTTTYNIAAAKHINEHYFFYAQKAESCCRTELFQQAVENAQYIPSNQPPFNSYEFESVYQVAYNQECITSLYIDQYEYLGGAHGSTFRLSDTWNFKTGGQIPLQQFYSPDILFSEIIFHEIESQIEKRLKDSPSSYFDDYPALLRKNFNPENYYLDSDGIVIYYQQYDIAPYSTGIPTFFIPIKENFTTCVQNICSVIINTWR